MESIFAEYLRLQQEKEELDQRILDCQCDLYGLSSERFDAIDNGTVHCEQHGFRLTVVKKETVKVDQKLAEVVGIGFSIKRSLDKKKFALLSAEDQKRVNECLTTSPAKPSFKVEVIDDN